MNKIEFIPIIFVKHLIHWGHSSNSLHQIQSMINTSQQQPIYDEELANLRLNQHRNAAWNPYTISAKPPSPTNSDSNSDILS